jgi:hypothetical protein
MSESSLGARSRAANTATFSSRVRATTPARNSSACVSFFEGAAEHGHQSTDLFLVDRYATEQHEVRPPAGFTSWRRLLATCTPSK